MILRVYEADLLDQGVEVIVNAWNRNIIPWWLLLPQGVSGAIKRRAGYEPFRELARHGPIPLGEAIQTSAGRLPFRAIIHVAGISLLWRSSERAIRRCVSSALAIACEQGSLGMYPGVTVTGTVGYKYAIQATADLSNTNSWTTVATLTLFQPIQLWVDFNVNALSPTNPHKYYRVMPGD